MIISGKWKVSDNPYGVVNEKGEMVCGVTNKKDAIAISKLPDIIEILEKIEKSVDDLPEQPTDEVYARIALFAYIEIVCKLEELRAARARGEA